MDFPTVVRQRRSIRTFAPREVPEAVLREVCAAALLAPSSLGGQPWFFVAVREPGIKRALAELKNRHCPPEKRMYSADFLAQAPVVLVVCVERARAHDRGVETAVLATAHVLLAAADQGLGSVYLSAYKADTPAVAQEIRELLGIPEGVDPVTIVPLGYPAEVPPERAVRALDEVLFHERFGRK
ncbi:MAG: nitroreductase family protein [Thermodesulfobacteriota bacterium]